jgi:hypothetical protein
VNGFSSLRMPNTHCINTGYFSTFTPRYWTFQFVFSQLSCFVSCSDKISNLLLLIQYKSRFCGRVWLIIGSKRCFCQHACTSHSRGGGGGGGLKTVFVSVCDNLQHIQVWQKIRFSKFFSFLIRELWCTKCMSPNWVIPTH